MDTLQQGAAPMALANMPMTADGTIDFRRLAVGLVEGCVNAAMEMAVEEIGRLEPRAAELLEDAREDALAYLAFPAEHRLRVRTNNVRERANREIKRRTDAVQVFPSSRSLVRLVGAASADQNDQWASGHFMDAEGMRDLGRDAESPAPAEETLRRAEVIVLETMRAAA